MKTVSAAERASWLMGEDAVPAVELVGLSKTYGRVHALKPVDLAVAHGELIAILGPSGSGKSTLLGLVAGTLAPDGGALRFRGKDVTKVPVHERGVGMIFQRSTLFPNRTVRENVAFPLEIRHLPPREIRRKVQEILALVGLEREADRYHGQISGGEAQRVALARALVFGPEILLMDEPLGMLDRSMRLALQVEIRRIQLASNVPTIYVTHDQEEAMHLADYIALIRDGRLVARGTAQELYETPASVWAARFLGDANVIPLRSWWTVDARMAAAVTEWGAQVIARLAPGLRERDAAALVVRPEDCEILVDGVPGSCPGTVVRKTFLGALQRAELEVPGCRPILVSAPRGLALPPVGACVHWRWAAERAVLVRDGECEEAPCLEREASGARRPSRDG